MTRCGASVTVGAVVLLSSMMRAAAITGRTDVVDARWFAGRQGGRWANQTVAAAFPTLPGGRAPAPTGAGRPPVDPAVRLRQLTELHQRGVVSDAELAALRARMGV
jgi:hypothetical protein